MVHCFNHHLERRDSGQSDVILKSPLRYTHAIDNFVNKVAVAAGLDVTKKHFTNHSIRKTTVKKLKKAGISATEIMAITGHKNQQSLRWRVSKNHCACVTQ